MLWLLLGLVAVGAFIWWVNRDTKLDSNDDGKVDTTEAKVEVKQVLDVNKDGKVTAADAVEAGKKVKAGAKKAAGKAKAAVKKTKKA